MRLAIRCCALVLLSLAAVAAGSPADGQPVYLELEPRAFEGLEGARLAVIAGYAEPGEAGPRFVLKELGERQPVDLMLESTSGGKLELVVFRNDPGMPSAEAATDSDGVATLAFRGKGPVYLMVRGSDSEGTPFVLTTMVGPEISLPAVAGFVPMSQAPPPPGAAPTTGGPIPGPSPAEFSRAGGGGSAFQWLVGLLLAAILVALLAIAALLFRRGGLARTTLLVAVALTPLVGREAAAYRVVDVTAMDHFDGWVESRMRHQSELDRTKAKLDEGRELEQELQQAVDARFPGNRRPLRPGEAFDRGFDFAQGRWKKYGEAMGHMNGKAKQMIAAAQLLQKVLEAYDVIPPLKPGAALDLSPSGLPPLPFSYLDELDPSAERSAAFREMTDFLSAAHRTLEANYVVLLDTQAEVKLLTELADSAAGLSPIAQLAWTMSKANPDDPVNQSRAAFFHKYETSQLGILEQLHEKLLEMDRFEAEQYGNPNWYAYYGSRYYEFLRERYTRI